MVTGLGLDNTAMSSNNSSGMSEIQRLIRKIQVILASHWSILSTLSSHWFIQGDGVKVLSLSERLFLMQHTGVAKNLNLTSSSDTEAGGSKERELARKLEILEFQLKQEKFLAEDLRKSLSHEKKNAFESLNKVGQERRSRAELESRIR